MRMVSSESIAEGTYCDACVQPESLEPECVRMGDLSYEMPRYIECPETVCLKMDPTKWKASK